MFYFFTSSSNIMLVLGIWIPQNGDIIEDSVSTNQGTTRYHFTNRSPNPQKTWILRCLGIWTTVMTHVNAWGYPICSGNQMYTPQNSALVVEYLTCEWWGDIPKFHIQLQNGRDVLGNIHCRHWSLEQGRHMWNSFVNFLCSYIYILYIIYIILYILY